MHRLNQWFAATSAAGFPNAPDEDDNLRVAKENFRQCFASFSIENEVDQQKIKSKNIICCPLAQCNSIDLLVNCKAFALFTAEDFDMLTMELRFVKYITKGDGVVPPEIAQLNLAMDSSVIIDICNNVLLAKASICNAHNTEILAAKAARAVRLQPHQIVGPQQQLPPAAAHGEEWRGAMKAMQQPVGEKMALTISAVKDVQGLFVSLAELVNLFYPSSRPLAPPPNALVAAPDDAISIQEAMSDRNFRPKVAATTIRHGWLGQNPAFDHPFAEIKDSTLVGMATFQYRISNPGENQVCIASDLISSRLLIQNVTALPVLMQFLSGFYSVPYFHPAIAMNIRRFGDEVATFTSTYNNPIFTMAGTMGVTAALAIITRKLSGLSQKPPGSMDPPPFSSPPPIANIETKLQQLLTASGSDATCATILSQLVQSFRPPPAPPSFPHHTSMAGGSQPHQLLSGHKRDRPYLDGSSLATGMPADDFKTEWWRQYNMLIPPGFVVPCWGWILDRRLCGQSTDCKHFSPRPHQWPQAPAGHEVEHRKLINDITQLLREWPV